MRRPGGHPFVASILDTVMQPMARIRDKVVPRARGRVLEVGVGTGLNLERYNLAQVEHLVGIDPDPHMRRRAEARRTELGIEAELLDAGAEAMPFERASFDTVVLTFTLCTVPDVAGSLAEIRRVLAPGGELLFAEHTQSDTPLTAWVQQAVHPVYTRFSGGCHLHRNAVALLEQAGFEIVELHGHGRGPLNLTPVHRGVARAQGQPEQSSR